MEEEQAVSAAVVLQSMSNVEERMAADKSGPPGEPGKTADELFDWSLNDSGVHYWRKGPASFEAYLQKRFSGISP